MTLVVDKENDSPTPIDIKEDVDLRQPLISEGDNDDPSTPVDVEKDIDLTERKFPDPFYCPITKNIMIDPVIEPDGESFERTAILQYLSDHDNESPITGKTITKDQLYPNRALREIISIEQENYNLSQRTDMEASLRRFDQSVRSLWGQLAERTPFTFLGRSLPDAFYCPITQEIMIYPFIDPEGNTFEHSAIAKWIRDNSCSPLTRTKVRMDQLYPNDALKAVVDRQRGLDDELMHPSIRRLNLAEAESPSQPYTGEVSERVEGAASAENLNEWIDEESERRRGSMACKFIGFILGLVLILLSIVFGGPYLVIFYTAFYFALFMYSYGH